MLVFAIKYPETRIEKHLIDSFYLDEERAKICAILIETNAKRWNIEWQKIAALMRVESNFDYYAKSQLTKGSKNELMQRAYGLMQTKPTTAKACADELDIPWNGLETVTNPIDNTTLGTYYYAKMCLIFPDFRKSVNAYNSGPQAVYNKSESLNNWYRVSYHYKRLKGQSDPKLAELIKKMDEEYIKSKADSVAADSLGIADSNLNKRHKKRR